MILILAPKDDPHANIVAGGLDALGAKHVRWAIEGSPSSHELSVDFGSDVPLTLQSNGVTWRPDDITTVWYRREGNVQPPDSLSTKSHQILEREWLDSRRGVYHLLSLGHALWVNPWVAAWRSENKVYQLEQAPLAGFDIPRTLISNSPEKIRAFFALNDGKIIHKMFYPARFGKATACTGRVDAALLANDEMLGLCPGIYQEELSIEFEVRVFVAGRAIVAAKLVNTGTRSIDSRIDLFCGQSVSAYSLPNEVAEKCIRLTRLLGLVSGSLDLIFTRDGKWLFLEVNQAGQFLWPEVCASDVRALDVFCRFLISGKSDFLCADAPTLRTEDFLPNQVSIANSIENGQFRPTSTSKGM